MAIERDLSLPPQYEIDPLVHPLEVHVPEKLGNLAVPLAWGKKSSGSGGGESRKVSKSKAKKTPEEQLQDAKDKATGQGRYAEDKRPKGKGRGPQ